MKYIIFGGNGFVGSYLTQALAKKGEQVIVADINPTIDEKINNLCDYKIVDIRSTSSLDQVKINTDDIVINLAANQYHTNVPKDAVSYFMDTNALGTKNILTKMLESGCRKYLMFTTDMIYGEPKSLPITTSHPQNPFGPYGESKKIAESFCKEFRQKGVNSTIMRPRMINGPGRQGILLKLFSLIENDFPVPLIGNGSNHYQMISVFDCVDALISAVEKGVPNEEYNLGSENPPTVKELLKALIKESGSKSILLPTNASMIKLCLSVLENMGKPLMYREQYMIADKEYVLDITKTKKELDWSPRFSDTKMIQEAFEEYRRTKESK